MQKSILSLFDLTGKVAIVTGGAMGIGLGIARCLSKAGADIMIVDIASPEDTQNTLTELRNSSTRISYIQADLREIHNLKNIVEQTCRDLGVPDILVNNAGVFNYCPMTELTEELWDKTLDLNLKAVAFLTQAVVHKMIENNKRGKIIHISSVDSLKPTGNLSHYDASKGGLRMLTRAFAKEVGKYGITVNDIAPGGVHTPGAQKMAGTGHTEEELAVMKAQSDQFIKMLPLQRMGEPEDIGHAALFLASDASAYMTGSTLVVDGGLLII